MPTVFFDKICCVKSMNWINNLGSPVALMGFSESEIRVAPQCFNALLPPRSTKSNNTQHYLRYFVSRQCCGKGSSEFKGCLGISVASSLRN